MVIAVQDQTRTGRAEVRSPGSSPQRGSRGRSSSTTPVFHRLGVGPSEGGLQHLPASFLRRGHGAFAPQRAVGEVIEEPGLRPDGEVEVEGEELGVLEGLEAIDDERFANGPAGDHLLVVEQAVASGSSELAGDGGVGDVEETGHLAQAGPFGGELGEARQEIAPAQPVVGGEGAGGEAPPAVAAAKALEPPSVARPPVEAVPHHAPVGPGSIEPAAAGSGSVGVERSGVAAGGDDDGDRTYTWSEARRVPADSATRAG